MALSLTYGICQHRECKNFTVEDETGIYNASTKTGGYGAPNMAIADVTAAVLDVYTPGSTTAEAVDVFPTLPNTDSTLFTVDNTDLGLGATIKLADGIYELEYKVTATYAISAVSVANKTFTINATDITGDFVDGVQFVVDGSTGNDGTYTTASSVLTATNTVITVDEAVPSATADGNIELTLTKTQTELFYCQKRSCLDAAIEKIEVDDCDCLTDEIQAAKLIDVFLKAAIYAAKCGKVNKAAKIMSHLTKLCVLKKCTTC